MIEVNPTSWPFTIMSALRAPALTERRASTRQSLDLAATLLFGGQRERCRLIDLSDEGAGVERPAFPPVPGEKVELYLEGHGWFPAEVVRVDLASVGLRLRCGPLARRRLAEALSPHLRTVH